MKYLPRTLLLLLVPSPLFAAFNLVDDFNSLVAGALNGQNGWNANTQWTVAAAPAGGSGNAASGQQAAGNGGAYRALSSIDNASTAATLFFRLYRTGAVNISAGLSDDAAPALFGGYEVQLNAQHNPLTPPGPTDSFKARDVGAFDDLGAGTFAVNTWYNVWLVVNNSTDTFEIYTSQGDFGTTGTPQTHLADPNGGDFAFGFRNGAATTALTTAIFAMGGTTPALTASLFVDDVYVDTGGQNLLNPVPEPSSAAMLGAAATLGLVSRRRNRRS